MREYISPLTRRSEYVLIDPTDGGQLTPMVIRLI